MATRSKKVFSSNSGEKKEPIVFTIDDTDFEARPSVSGLTLMELVRDAGEGGSVSMGAILRYLRKAMPESEYKKFEDYVEEHDVDIVLVNEIISYLIETQTERPTE